MIDFAFEWDPAKDAAHRRKRGISFAVATQVFRDPFHISDLDQIEGGEYRWQTIGCVNDATFLLVVHAYRDTEQNTIIRIISARRADRSDRKRHDSQNG